MTALPDEELSRYHKRVGAELSLSPALTGGAAGIGRATALLFASYGANVVIADMNMSSAEQTVLDIQKLRSGDAVAHKCDVTVYEDIVNVFDFALDKFGSVDIVVANAGVGEIGGSIVYDPKEGIPTKPATTTIDINLIGVLYTLPRTQPKFSRTRLPQIHHSSGIYMQVPSVSSESLVLTVRRRHSVDSWTANSRAPLYVASKHAVLGLMRSLDKPLSQKGIHINCIHPFYAATNLVPSSVRQLQLAGIPLTPVPRIAKAIVYAASYTTTLGLGGSSFWVPDGGALTFMIPKEEFKPGVYQLIDAKSNSTSVGLSGPRYYARFLKDVTPWLWKPLALASTSATLLTLGVRFIMTQRVRKS
ncbi:hypothetical protein D9757_004421 [Collybiopsis confluens]|uniref:NAD(P)-binding protein n=1 Tax=Collybiopsis confluens TaxID=2823264 RepID=A0A8H5MEA6_9AGAR|nr:hypothetical protein D9757_004421 [Collybiopsis confluens]